VRAGIPRTRTEEKESASRKRRQESPSEGGC
jgi:hypothetical protein